LFFKVPPVHFLFLIFVFFPSGLVHASPLGTLPSVISGKTQAQLLLRSDIWAQPLRAKKTPLRRTDGSLQVPLFQNDSWTLSGGIVSESLSLSRTDLVVGEDQIQVGTDLQYQGVNLGVEHRSRDRSWSQAFVTYESASDHPFVSSRDVNLDVFAFHAFHWKSRFWVLGMDLSDNRGYFNGQPLPLFGMIYQPNAHTEITFGFPFFRLNAQGKDAKWNFLAFVTPSTALFNAHRRLNENFQIFMGASLRAWSYMHSKRTNDENRLFFQETALEGGIRYPLSSRVFMINSLGTSFHRKIYEAKRVYSRSGAQQDLNADEFVALKLEFTL
jgi:hypothetical protein